MNNSLESIPKWVLEMFKYFDNVTNDEIVALSGKVINLEKNGIIFNIIFPEPKPKADIPEIPKTKLVRNYSTPESKKFWENIIKSAAEVKKQPQWLQDSVRKSIKLEPIDWDSYYNH